MRSEPGIGRFCFLQRLDDRGIEIGGVDGLPLCEIFYKLAIPDQDCVVPSLEPWLAGYIVIWRRLDEDHACCRQGGAQHLHHFLVAGAVGAENLGIEGAIAAVVHSEHDRNHGRPVDDHVTIQTEFRGATSPTGHAVSAPSRMDEVHLHLWKARENKGLCEGGVQALICDAVAVKDNPVAISQIEACLRRGI
jgi:hypothetical protein